MLSREFLAIKKLILKGFQILSFLSQTWISENFIKQKDSETFLKLGKLTFKRQFYETNSNFWPSIFDFDNNTIGLMDLDTKLKILCIWIWIIL